jgi:SagB-type dehydrogenase family enzyme
MRFFNSAKQYHELTKYSFDNVKSLYREYNPDKTVGTVKLFTEKKAIKLPKPEFVTQSDIFSDFQRSAKFATFYKIKNFSISLEMISPLLYLTNGVTLLHELNTGKIAFRSAPSASALYPIDIYLIIDRAEGLEKGLYYYNPVDFTLMQLVSGEIKNNIVSAGYDLNVLKQAPIFLIFVSVFERNFWKFKERAFRYALLDAGYIIQNLVLAASTLNLSAYLIGDFVDKNINDLLGIQNGKEGTILIAPIGEVENNISNEKYRFGMLNEEEDYISPKESNIIETILKKTSHFFPSQKTVDVNVELPFVTNVPIQTPKNNLINLSKPLEKFGKSTRQIIEERRSIHNFARIPIKEEEVSTLLSYLRLVPVLYNYPAFKTYFVSSDVKDLVNGIYLYHPFKHQIELLKRGTFRGDLSYLTLGQDAVFNCSVSFFFSVDFEEINIFSNRGYRYAHINIGMLSETVYLVATALGLGARGIGHFFDDNINSFFLVNEPNENILGGAIVGHY